MTGEKCHWCGMRWKCPECERDEQAETENEVRESAHPEFDAYVEGRHQKW